MPRFLIRDGRPDFAAPIQREQWRSLRMEDQFDAVLYLGPPSAITIAKPSTAICSDPASVQPRLARMALTGLPQAAVDQLKQLCATVAPK
jgi:hypothetical protein